MIKGLGAAAMLMGACACSSSGERRPVLTAGAARRVASACGAADATIGRAGKPLPYAYFTLPGGASARATTDRDAVLVCLASRMPGYRYDFYGIR